MANNKRTIDHLKESGSYRKGTHGEDHLSPEKPKSIPKPPAELINPFARTEWTRIVTALFNQDQLVKMDYGALAQLCNQYGIAREIEKKIVEEFGSWADYYFERNYQTDNEARAYNTALNLYFKTMGMFGVTPVERSRITVDPKAKGKRKLERFKPV